eukprot:TRINITY_DN3224_c0_g1_i4.p1 TRINITY_DN3224_c0_g1~~TRINITY_DN3224_c0_g1_i4.p1  ORF type:complete len:832 (-),score=152.34 TRINITY_DN3224_c0_g1_i4:56-2551(-)
MVLQTGPRAGRLVLTPTSVLFFFDKCADIRRWPLVHVTCVYPRRYMLLFALEFFISTARRGHFFAFSRRKLRNSVATTLNEEIAKLHSGLPRHVEWEEDPRRLSRLPQWTTMWKQREISNFEYLMKLNTAAGRSYNDLSQYPVFPWVLSDYDSPTIDTNDPSVYRDLSKPVGALTQKRLEEFWERYREMEKDDTIPPFLYGSHYSTIGSVLYWLVRVEPFSTIARDIQGGEFDVADRMFYSISSAWKNCLSSSSDVKELTPEFFYFPDFLVNGNNFDLGERQCGDRVHDVELPPWAATPDEFIRINRRALESENVSAHLHQWVDLIFGYKQRGQEAIKASNVFYYLTYGDTLDVSKLKGEGLSFEAIKLQVQYYGQTPSQLFRSPHPARDPPRSVSPTEAQAVASTPTSASLPLQLPLQQMLEGVVGSSVGAGMTAVITGEHPRPHPPARPLFTPDVLLKPYVIQPIDFTPTCAKTFRDHILVVSAQPPAQRKTSFASFEWSNSPSPTYGWPFTFSEVSAGDQHYVSLHDQAQGEFAPPFEVHSACPGWLFAASAYRGTICTLRCTAGPIKQIEQEVDISNYGEVRCIALSRDGSYLLAGCSNNCALLWDANISQQTPILRETPRQVLRGHTGPVVLVCVDPDIDTCLTGDENACLLHNIKKGRLIRWFKYPNLQHMVLLRSGNVVLCNKKGIISLFTMNGRFAKSVKIARGLRSLVATSDDRFLITGTGNRVYIIDVDQMAVTHNIALNTRQMRIANVCPSFEEKCLIVCMEVDTAAEEEKPQEDVDGFCLTASPPHSPPMLVSSSHATGFSTGEVWVLAPDAARRRAFV